MPTSLRHAVVAATGILAAAGVPPALAQTFSGLMSGSWWDASRAGEGQFINFESAGGRHVAWLAYFTYTADGRASWQVGSVDYAPGATTLEIPLVTGAGPVFGPAYDPSALSTASAGTATLEFVSCRQLRLRHSAMAGITLNLTRLVGPLAGTDCTQAAPDTAAAASPASAHSGGWWNAARWGEGQFVTLESVGTRKVASVAYFTYTPDGRANWLVGNADYSPGASSVTIPLLTGSGPRFGAAYRAADFTSSPAGSARLDFLSCARTRLTYSGTPPFAVDLSRLVGPLTGYACSDKPAATLVSGPSPLPAGCGAGAGTSYPNAEVEPSLAANPRNPEHLLAMWQQDRWSNGSARALVSAVSFDGGASWSARPMPFSRCGGGTAAGGGDFERATDPWVSFGPDGTAWAMSLSTSGPVNAMLVSRSTDGGLGWSAPVSLINETTPYFNDKNALTADPYDARFAYAVWDRLRDGSSSGPAMFARTTDGGATWESTREIFNPGASSQTIGNLIVSPADGALVNVTLQIDYLPGNARESRVVAIRSANRGQSWSGPVTIERSLAVGARDPENGTPIRDGAIIPQAAAGPGGLVHVVWQDSRFSGGARDAVAYSRSADGGLTWSAPVRVNRDPSVAAFTPTVHVLADGTLGVSYFDLRDNTADATTLLAGYFLARSTDGGATWQETRLAEPFDLDMAPNANGLFLGDYMGLAGSGGAFHALFVRTTGDPANRNDVFHARVPGSAAAVALAKGAVEGVAWSEPWAAQPAAPFAVDAGWRARTGEAIDAALRRRGRPVPP